MQKLFRNVPLFRLMIVLVFSSTMMVACTGNETKTENKETVIEKKDSLPPLDTHDSSSTRPETIKNKN